MYVHVRTRMHAIRFEPKYKNLRNLYRTKIARKGYDGSPQPEQEVDPMLYRSRLLASSPCVGPISRSHWAYCLEPDVMRRLSEFRSMHYVRRVIEA